MTDDPTATLHLRALRACLRRDFLAQGRWRESLMETAETARAAVNGRRAFVALKGEDGRWTGFTDDGAPIDDAVIGVVSSMTLLTRVYESLEPVITSVAAPLSARSHSIDRNDIRNVLVVPLRVWSREDGLPAARAAGCLYVDRPGTADPFEQADIDLVLDLANVLERSMALLRQLGALELELDRARRRLTAHAEGGYETYQLHSTQSKDPGFIRTVLEPLKRAARADRVSLLLVGPTGAGKTHLAQSFHYESRRREGPFVVLDCGQVSSSEALGAELFGFARQSGYNVPKEGRHGKAALADGGTLFIDEVATLPLDLQQRLLRLLEKGRITPLGGSLELEVDVQVVAASNEDLGSLVGARRFREDLYWRLSEVAVRVPSLDEHPADIPDLVEVFLAKATQRFDRRGLRRVEPAALARLQDFPWSRAGNTRGLEHAINRSVLLAPDDQESLGLDDLVLPDLLQGPDADPAGRGPTTPESPPAPAPRLPAPKQAMRDLLGELIDEHAGVIAKVAAAPRLAAAFGLPGAPVPISTVRLRIRQLGLEDAVVGARARAELRLDDLLQALRRHGSGTAAAKALGISRDALTWRLRQAGLTVRQVLRGDPADE